MAPRRYEEPVYVSPRPRGRPRKQMENGHNVGTAHQDTRMENGDARSALVRQTVVPIAPRLLDLPATALYLGVSEWTVRDLEAAGILRRVRIPLPHDGQVRKLLFDKQDLDNYVDTWKDRT